MTQSRLFPDPQPLVERLGGGFFRALPQTPGVYLMRDRAATVLYVGKAKNLRKRLGSYRVANPERMPRRTLRLLRLVEQIGWEECCDEAAALRRESELLLTLKPRFNRAGVWQRPKRYLVWRCTDGKIQFAVTENPEEGFRAFGPMGAQARVLHDLLVRLIWFGAHPQLGITGMPVGWAQGCFESPAIIDLGASAGDAVAALEHFPRRRWDVFCEWLRIRTTGDLHPFVKAAVESDLQRLDELFGNGNEPLRRGPSITSSL